MALLLIRSQPRRWFSSLAAAAPLRPGGDLAARQDEGPRSLEHCGDNGDKA